MTYRVKMGCWNGVNYVLILRPAICGRNVLFTLYPEGVVVNRFRG